MPTTSVRNRAAALDHAGPLRGAARPRPHRALLRWPRVSTSCGDLGCSALTRSRRFLCGAYYSLIGTRACHHRALAVVLQTALTSRRDLPHARYGDIAPAGAIRCWRQSPSRTLRGLSASYATSTATCGGRPLDDSYSDAQAFGDALSLARPLCSTAAIAGVCLLPRWCRSPCPSWAQRALQQLEQPLLRHLSNTTCRLLAPAWLLRFWRRLHRPAVYRQYLQQSADALGSPTCSKDLLQRGFSRARRTGGARGAGDETRPAQRG